MKPETVSQTSAVFVKDGTFEEPMEYPQGAKTKYVRCLQAHHCCGIQNPGMRHPYYTAGSQKRLHGTGGGFSFPTLQDRLQSLSFQRLRNSYFVALLSCFWSERVGGLWMRCALGLRKPPEKRFQKGVWNCDFRVPDTFLKPFLKEIRTAIAIDAPAERVWRNLTDFGNFPQWNPFFSNSPDGQWPASTALLDFWKHDLYKSPVDLDRFPAFRQED